MPRITLSTVLRLLLASLLVGAPLALLGFTPQELLDGLRGLIAALIADFRGWLSFALTSLLLGALVVVPIWLVSRLWQLLKRRS
ncbi:hypothetical protein HRbin40_01567 [bacterium HR40]|nr:hypothetical protein HRbin40_01567 [bacterium HR40]